MPEIIERGKLVDLENRWPHTEKFMCPKCETKFRLTPQDSQDNYYQVGTAEREAGMQWDTYTEHYLKLKIPCPCCDTIIERAAPAGWTLAFAQGKPESR